MTIPTRAIDHALAELGRLLAEAATGPCALHPDLPAVAVVTGSAFRPKGACENCAAHAEHHRYTVYRNAEETA